MLLLFFFSNNLLVLLVFEISAQKQCDCYWVRSLNTMMIYPAPLFVQMIYFHYNIYQECIKLAITSKINCLSLSYWFFSLIKLLFPMESKKFIHSLHISVKLCWYHWRPNNKVATSVIKYTNVNLEFLQV